MKSSRTFLSLLANCLLISLPAAAAVTVPAGFRAEIAASGPDLTYIAAIAFDGDGTLFAGEADVLTNRGRVLRLDDFDGDGRIDAVVEVANGFGLVTGVTFRGEGFPIAARACRAPKSARSPNSEPAYTDLERIRRGQFRGRTLDLYVAHFTPGVGGTVTLLRDRDRDGVREERIDVAAGLPSDGDSGNQQIAVAADGRLYFGQGARTNAGVPGPGSPPDTPFNATILSMNPDGSDLRVVARGLRNAYDLAFDDDGELFATENGPDPSGPGPIVGAPDELNAIVDGADYGWPDFFGHPPTGSGTLAPVVEFAPSTSSDGIAVMTSGQFCGYRDEFFVAQFGSFSDPGIGRGILHIGRIGNHGFAPFGFATGFGRPLDLAVGPDGALWVADFSSAFFAPRTATIHRIMAIDSDGDGRSDLCD